VLLLESFFQMPRAWRWRCSELSIQRPCREPARAPGTPGAGVPLAGLRPGGSGSLHSRWVWWLTLGLYLVRNASASLLLLQFPLGTELVNSCCTKNNTCASPWQPLSLPWLNTDPKAPTPGADVRIYDYFYLKDEGKKKRQKPTT